MIGGVPKFGHISEFMRDTLHRLPVRQRIHYSLSTIVWRCVLGIAPTYLLKLFILTSACGQSLRSASRGDFVVPHGRTAIKQHSAFSMVGPSAWSSLPSEIRSLPRDLSSSFYIFVIGFLFDFRYLFSLLLVNLVLVLGLVLFTCIAPFFVVFSFR